MARKSSLTITLTGEAHAGLTGLLRATKTRAGLARRAWAILLVADGQNLTAVGKQVGMTSRHVRKWVRRFLKAGLPGLLDGKRSGRPPVFSPGRGGAPGEDRLRIAG